MTDTIFEQKGSMGSTNVQIQEQNNQYGLSYTDVTSLCKDLIHSEFSTYKASALQTAIEREEKLRNSIFEKLAKEKVTNENILEEFKNPDLQFSYVNAQKAFIRVGTSELENVLSELLLKRIKENSRTLLQLVLNESLNIVPMLLPEQLNILSLCFMLKYTQSKTIKNLDSLKKYLSATILPHVVSDLKKESLYQHIEYARCGQVGLLEIKLETILGQTYRGLFLKGLPLAEIAELKSKYPNLFLPCLNNQDLWQVGVLNQQFLEKVLNETNKDGLPKELAEINTNDDDNKKIMHLFNKNVMNDEEIKNKVIELLPSVTEAFALWNNSDLNKLTLTSVGIVIGATYSKQISGEEYDLSIWI